MHKHIIVRQLIYSYKPLRFLHVVFLSCSTVSILLVRKANAKGNVSGFEIAPPSKGGGSDKHLALN